MSAAFAAALLRENLTVATLHEATSAGGSMLLFAALNIDGLALRRGDRTGHHMHLIIVYKRQETVLIIFNREIQG